MSWVTVLWSALASAGLTLGTVHLLVWLRKPAAAAHLLYFLIALGTAGFSAFELWLMRAATPEEAGLALRWMHLPVWAVVVSLVGFVRYYLRAGRPWLAWAVCVVRTLALALNFLVSPNLQYRKIDALRSTPFLGEQLSVVVGVPNPWMLVGQASLVLLVIFVVDACAAVWRRGDRRLALAVGGSIVFFVLGASVQTALVFWGLVSAPIVPSLFYQALVAVMGVELSYDVIRAARLSDEVREDRQRIHLAATAARLALWTWDVPQDRIWVTPEGRPLHGIPPEGPITLERFLNSLHVDDRGSIRDGLQRALLDGGAFDAEYRVALPDGAERWMAGRGKVELDPQGRPARLRAVSWDISERKLAERQAQRHRQEAAHLSRVTTIGEISGSLAHELNQPLAAILTNAKAAELHLQRGQPDLSEVLAILADIRTDDLRASAILQRIRAFLKRNELDKRPLDLPGLVDDTIGLIGGIAADRQCKVSAEVSPGLPLIEADRIHLQQVLVNLLLNGLDAMDTCAPGDRSIVVRARLVDSDTLEIEVSDAGDGLSPEDLARAFEPFHTTKQHGLGLGLPISRSIVEAHGGSILLENNPGRGATARVRLPLRGERPS